MPKPTTVRRTAPAPHQVRSLLFALLVATGVGVAPPALHAEQLALRSGESIETTGAWRVDGSRVLYRDRSGSLRSIRLTEVDLDRRTESTSTAMSGQRNSAASLPATAIRITDETLASERRSAPAPAPELAASEPQETMINADGVTGNQVAPAHDPTTFLLYDEMALMIDERYRDAMAVVIGELALRNEAANQKAKALLDVLGERILKDHDAAEDIWRVQALALLTKTLGAQGARAEENPEQLQLELARLIASSEERGGGARRRRNQLGR